ncbi:transporter substrate-binding domain-containing protein [Acuticoccus mangrovi]|uniref:Transporter substrate-binding domain-containing protein n=1 Tax=Acuticoccus mangrovi TaxID=2796142 RepID=A0A934ISL4_9HYPH|nr:transporter substrate-binding domain-containing protein [Acuticoccus mangrovi]MBJ3777965.1 transporter substrate-binding domain-containing protein [Acuticoccus mangrovi]
MDRREVLMLSGLTAAATLTMATSGAQAQEIAEPTSSNLNQIRESGELRLGVIPNQEPHFHRDINTGVWSGAALTMANNLAGILGVEVVPHETTWTNAVTDLRTNKIDLAFGLQPTPTRALAVDFSAPLYNNAYVCVTRRGQPEPTEWAELNTPDTRLSVVQGTTYEIIARRLVPQASITAYKSRDDSLLSLVAGHSDYAIDGAILAIKQIKANPSIGSITVPTPIVALPSCAAMRIDTDKRLRDIMSVWAAHNRALGQTREWVVEAFQLAGVEPEDVPDAVQF